MRTHDISRAVKLSRASKVKVVKNPSRAMVTPGMPDASAVAVLTEIEDDHQAKEFEKVFGLSLH